MEDKITVPDHIPDLKEKGSTAATKRRENYSLVRDLRAKENNEAIALRLAREKEKHG